MMDDVIIKVDLSRNKITKQSLPHSLKQSYIGGRGVNAKLLFDEVEPGTDAYSPRNALIIGAGPLVGSGAPGSGRINVTARSPLTILGDSNTGGDWGPELKFAGYSYILITGRSEKPVYLWIHDDEVQLKDAKDLWGTDTWEAEQRIREGNGVPNVKVASIGPAGENLVRYACVKFGHRTAGRCGLGGVMGSKRLKAIAVKGSRRKLELADRKNFTEATLEAIDKIEFLKDSLGAVMGGTYGVLWFTHNEASMMVTKHFRSGFWEEADKLDPKLFYNNYKIKRIGCFACPIRCTPYYEIPSGKYRGSYTKVEYGQIVSFSAAVDVSDLSIALKACEMADSLGLDAKSCGYVIGFAMDLFEHGIIDERDVGFPLKWGDGQAVLNLIEMIASRKGFGDVLAEGEYRAAKKLGGGAEDYALTVKYMVQHEPLRAQVGNALAQYVSSRGPDHLRGSCHAERDMPPEDVKKFFGYEDASDPLSYDHKAPIVIFYEHIAALADMLGICKFFTQWLSMYSIDPELMARLTSSATGINIGSQDLIKAAERVVNLERAFIVREGIRRINDYPPRREFEEPLPDGPFKGKKLDREKYDRMLSNYYELRGWSVKTGIPLKDKLEELRLNDVASDLVARRIIS